MKEYTQDLGQITYNHGDAFLIKENSASGEITLNPTRMESLIPAQYRLAKRDGVLILQGAYHWSEGFSKNGYEWRDIPTVDL